MAAFQRRQGFVNFPEFQFASSVKKIFTESCWWRPSMTSLKFWSFKAGISNTSGLKRPARCIRAAWDSQASNIPKDDKIKNFDQILFILRAFLVNCVPQKFLSNKLWPAENFFFRMWPSDKFEFKTPDLKALIIRVIFTPNITIKRLYDNLLISSNRFPRPNKVCW